jgi:hypothetical protein
MHVEQQILNAGAALLVDETDALDRVYVDRLDPLKPSQLPAITVNDAGTQIDAATLNSGERFFDVEFSCCRKRTGNDASEVREFGLAVEKLIAADAGGTLAALCGGGFDLLSARLQQDGTAEDPYLARVLTVRFVYHVDPATPDVAIP